MKDGLIAKIRRTWRARRLVGPEAVALLRQELTLAKEELAQKAKIGAQGAILFGVALAVGLAALGSAVAAAILALAILLPSWAAALIVSVACGLIAGLAALSGKRAFAQVGPPLPEEALKEAKQDLRALAQVVEAR